MEANEPTQPGGFAPAKPPRETAPAGSPLTVGTAGHIDHGKTALVRALTGVDTDRLPEERARGITIALGFAPLRLPGGRRLSLVDVPGHERLVRVMVSGATGIDLFLLVIAADDGVMPQTLEHVRVLEALGVHEGVVAVTKADLADPEPALRAARELLPAAEAVPCSARAGSGITELAAALERAAGRVRGRSQAPGAAALHVDRVFTIRGAGTVVTGTLWSGTIRAGDRLRLLPRDQEVRIRAVQVHDTGVQEAAAGQRVAVNLAGVARDEVQRGDALVGRGSPVSATYRIDAQLVLHEPLADRERVQVHHGTRAVPARALRRDEGTWQLRLEQPLLGADGDRLVLRRISPPGTLGGGTIVRASARGGSADAAADRPPAVAPAVADELVAPGAVELEERLRAAGFQGIEERELGDAAAHLAALRRGGRAARIGRAIYVHAEAIASVTRVVERLIAAEGQVTLARLRDELGTSRKYAQALLEHLDAARVTRRREDDSRVLRRRAQEEGTGNAGAAAGSSRRS